MNSKLLTLPVPYLPIDLGAIERSIQEIQADIEDAKHASGYYRRLTEMIIDFEKDIDLDKEVGIRLVSFGQTLNLYINDIGYYNPSLITFDGADQAGNAVKLIQHISQINFLLIVVPKRPQVPERRRIGFFLQEKLKNEKTDTE